MARNRYSQPTKEELTKKADASKKRAGKHGKILEPIIIQGRKITSSFWGNAWCINLESYADFASRIDRGKRYVRNGSVIDLKIKNGYVEAKVQGSRKKPYDVKISIDPLSESKNEELKKLCGSKIENIESLVTGSFPEELKSEFLKQGALFPTPREIHFSCSCPDWAYMCKHVAAVLYGIGAKFDQDPLLFFLLRGLDVNQFIDHTIQNKVDTMLKNINNKTDRIMEDVDLKSVFGNLYD